MPPRDRLTLKRRHSFFISFRSSRQKSRNPTIKSDTPKRHSSIYTQRERDRAKKKNDIYDCVYPLSSLYLSKPLGKILFGGGVPNSQLSIVGAGLEEKHGQNIRSPFCTIPVIRIYILPQGRPTPVSGNPTRENNAPHRISHTLYTYTQPPIYLLSRLLTTTTSTTVCVCGWWFPTCRPSTSPVRHSREKDPHTSHHSFGPHGVDEDVATATTTTSSASPRVVEQVVERTYAMCEKV